MSPKNFIKKIVPESLVFKYRENREHLKVKREFAYDAKQYNLATNFHMVGSSDKGIEELIIFHSHALEKGLSHPNFRPNFGKRALSGLAANMTEFKRRGLDKSKFSFQNAESVLRAYKQKHVAKGINTEFFDSLFMPLDDSDSPLKAGAVSHENIDASSLNFKELEKYRSTQREFSNTEVDLGLIKAAVKLSIKTPSVCNRQPWKLHLTTDPDKIQRLLKIQKGFNGYEIPPVLSMVTVDRRSFIGSFERNEAYIDGGLFLMNYVFALTSYGLASCILNAMLPNDELEKIRQIYGIPEEEVLIAFVAVGNPLNDLQVAASERKPLSEIIKITK